METIPGRPRTGSITEWIAKYGTAEGYAEHQAWLKEMQYEQDVAEERPWVQEEDEDDTDQEKYRLDYVRPEEEDQSKYRLG